MFSHYVTPSLADPHYILFVEIDMLLVKIRSSRISLLDTPFVFGTGGYIRPIECDQVMDISIELVEIVEKARSTLTSVDKLVPLSNHNHYKLLMHLYGASDKSSKLNELLRKYRSICLETTEQQRRSLSKIQTEISFLTELCEQAEGETEDLLAILAKYLPVSKHKLPQ